MNNEQKVQNTHVSQHSSNEMLYGVVGKREIKFRFWLGHTKKMTYEHSLIDIAHLFWDFTEDIIPLQFTGLLDKNGKEIYEGDITKNFNCEPHAVVFKNGAFGYMINNEEDYSYFVSFAGNNNFSWEDNISYRIEIVGNIFENTELLNGGSNAV